MVHECLTVRDDTSIDITVPSDVASLVSSSLISFGTIRTIFSSLKQNHVVHEVVCNTFLTFKSVNF